MAEQVFWQPMVLLSDYERLRQQADAANNENATLRRNHDMAKKACEEGVVATVNMAKRVEALELERAAWVNTNGNWRLMQERTMKAFRDAQDEAARLKKACAAQNQEVCQTLGKALECPWFKDDQKNFPGSTEEDGVCVGDQVAETLAAAAAGKIEELEATLGDEEAAHTETLDRLRRTQSENDRLYQLMEGHPDAIKLTAEAIEKRLGTNHWAVLTLAESLANTFKEGGTKNMVVSDIKTTDGFEMIVTVQRKDGKSPVEMLCQYLNSHNKMLDSTKDFLSRVHDSRQCMCYAGPGHDHKAFLAWQSEWQKAHHELTEAIKEAEKINAESKAETT